MLAGPMGNVDRLAAALGITSDALWRAVGTAAVLLLWPVVRRLSRRLIVRAIDDPGSRYSMTRATSFAVGAVAFIIIARLWIQGIAGIATYFGLLSAGVAIALQDPLTNLAGWLFILIRRPFRFLMLEVGNWVHADQGTGRLLHVPNGAVFKNTIANYDEAFGYIWNELEVTITFESDWRAAKKALEGILTDQSEEIDDAVRQRIDEAAHVLHIRMPKLTPVVWTSVVEHGVVLTMRHLCKPRLRRSSTSQIWEKVLEAFAAMDDVDFAYPTTRRFDNIIEGKRGARAVNHGPPPKD